MKKPMRTKALTSTLVAAPHIARQFCDVSRSNSAGAEARVSSGFRILATRCAPTSQLEAIAQSVLRVDQ